MPSVALESFDVQGSMKSSTSQTPTGLANLPEALARAYDSPFEAAREQHAQGVPVVAIVGNSAPPEYCHARGAMPLYIRPNPLHSTPLADRYIASESWRMRSIVDVALSGELEFARLLVLTRGSEWIYYNLKEIFRRGEGEKLPALHMHDYVPTHNEEADLYNRDRNRALAETLDREVGPVREGGWERAAQLSKRRHSVLSRLQRLRDEGRVPGAQALRAIGAGYALPAESYLDELEPWLASLEQSQTISRERLLILTAHELDTPILHDTLEAAGALVVAEDSWWGSRAAGSALEELDDPVEAVHRRLRRDVSGVTVSPRAVREQWVNERMARKDIDTVVFYVPSSDLVFGWDYPKLKARAESFGLRTLLLNDRLDSEEGRASLQQKAQDFFGRASDRRGLTQ